MPKGEELSKLIIYDNILKKQSKEYDEKNLSDAQKKRIIGEKENNVIEIFVKKEEKCKEKEYDVLGIINLLTRVEDKITIKIMKRIEIMIRCKFDI